MNKHQQQTLEDLRNAAKQDKWNLCREYMAKLLPDLTQADTVKVVIKQAHRFLSTLSSAHSEDADIVRAIQTLNNVASLHDLDEQGRFIDSILDKYWNSPGVSNFRNALKGISKPEQYFNHSGDFIETSVSLLSNILLATAISIYWVNNPEFSKTFFGQEVRNSIFLLAKHNSNPRQIELRASLWNELSSDLENALQFC